MGVTVIGGLIVSTFLTLLLVPAYFSIAIDIEYVDRAQARPSSQRHRARGAGRRSTPAPAAHGHGPGAATGGVNPTRGSAIEWSG